MTLSEEIISKLNSKRSIHIGRSENEQHNDIVVHDNTVSRTHCKLEITEENKIKLTDLKSNK